MITIEQIKAARGLLEWTQDDLADRAVLSRPAINNLERRITKPHAKTMLKIRSAFEKYGVDFIEGGVRLRQSVLHVKTLEGAYSFLTLMDDVFDTYKDTGGELLISGVRERAFLKIGGKRLLDILKKYELHGIKEKILICHGDHELIQPPEYYRWIPKEIFSQVPYFVYGDKYAMVLFKPLQRVVVIENRDIAQSYRAQFYAHWENGEVPKT